MTTCEAKEAFGQTDLAILPVGVVEGHGPHNPLFTDSTAAWELARRVGEKMHGLAIVAPLLAYGVSHILKNFEGTISLRDETLLNVIRDVSDSLIHWGIRRIFIVNGHGGNDAAITTIGYELYEKGVLCAFPNWWDVLGCGHLNERWANSPLEHGGFTETMINLIAMPQGVHLDRYVPAKVGYQMTDMVKVDAAYAKFQGGQIPVNLPFDRSWPHGFTEPKQGIPATEATKEEGERMLEALAQYFADFLAEFRKAPLPAHD